MTGEQGGWRKLQEKSCLESKENRNKVVIQKIMGENCCKEGEMTFLEELDYT